MNWQSELSGDIRWAAVTSSRWRYDQCSTDRLSFIVTSQGVAHSVVPKIVASSPPLSSDVDFDCTDSSDMSLAAECSAARVHCRVAAADETFRRRLSNFCRFATEKRSSTASSCSASVGTIDARSSRRAPVLCTSHSRLQSTTRRRHRPA